MVCFFSTTGDVHVGMVDRGGQLEVEVNQARGLTPKPGSKNIPGTLNWHQPTALKASFVPICMPRYYFHCVVFCCFVCSNIREGVCAWEWSVFGQEENQSSKEESGPHLPAGSVVWRESSGQSPTGMWFIFVPPHPINKRNTNKYPPSVISTMIGH